jgi:hypothetical protein
VQTDFNTGIGFFLGWSGGVPKFSIGDPAGQYLTWDGSNVKFNGQFATGFSAAIGGGPFTLSSPNGPQGAGSRTVTISNGRAPYTIQWTLVNIHPNATPDTANAWMSGETTATMTLITEAYDNIVLGRALATVTDADGRVATAAVAIVHTHGTPP